MKKTGRTPKLILTTISIALTIFFGSGCTAEKKPLPPSAPQPRINPQTTYPTKNPAITNEEKNGLNNKLATAVKKVNGVRRSTVVVIGTSAYAGLVLEPDLTKAQLESVRPMVASVIKTTEPRIRTVWTATNPTTVLRIDRVRAAIRANKPASSYASDLRGIINESDLAR